MTQTLTTEAMQEIYEAAVHSEASGSQEAEFELLCKLEDVGGTNATIRKLIDMVRAANREAQPVAYLKKSIIDSERFDSSDPEIILHPNTPEGWHSEYQAVFTAPPAPAVPGAAKVGEMPFLGSSEPVYVKGWNDCRAAMLAQPVSQGYKLVPVEPTEEMIAAAMNCDDVEFNSDETFCVNFDNIYRAMLAAAPEGSNG